jgi:hypothetical protein
MRKSILIFCLLIAVSILISGCAGTAITSEPYDPANVGSQLPETKPSDFNFVYSFGVGPVKNVLDTANGKFTKDMIMDPSITTDLFLSAADMSDIYSNMKSINILNYPDIFNPESNMSQTPFETYSLKIIFNGKEKDIYWEDEHDSQTGEAIKLRELFNKISKIIYAKDEYKRLPQARGGYD